jgi:hypothetical protein
LKKKKINFEESFTPIRIEIPTIFLYPFIRKCLSNLEIEELVTQALKKTFTKKRFLLIFFGKKISLIRKWLLGIQFH